MYLEGLGNAAEAEKKKFQSILLGERAYWLEHVNYITRFVK